LSCSAAYVSPRAAAAAGSTSSFIGLGWSDEDLDLRFLLEPLDERVGVLLLLLPLEELLDLGRRFVERHHTTRLDLDHLDDVVAELGGDDAAQLPGLEGERRLLEGRDHLAAREVAEVAALRGGAVLRVLLRELAEIL